MTDEEEKEAKTGDINVNDLVPCVALCCCIFSCYTELPDCLGSVCENTILCCLCKIMTCKTSKEEGAFCKCFNADCDCIHFKTCCTVGYNIIWYVPSTCNYISYRQKHNHFALIVALLFLLLKKFLV